MDRATDGLQQTSSSGSFSSESLLLMHTQENYDQEPTTDSPENLKQVLIPTLDPRSSYVEDDEATVDLTEPRFESFCVSNISSAS